MARSPTRQAQLDEATKRAVEDVAERAAKRAVRRANRENKKMMESAVAEIRSMFVKVGINVETDAAKIAHQSDQAFLHRLHNFSRSLPSKIILSCIATAISAFGGLLVLALQHYFPGLFTTPK